MAARSGLGWPNDRNPDVPLKMVLLAPVLFALGFVLTVYADSGRALESLPRPLVIAAAGALLIQGVATLLLRNGLAGAAVALVALVGVAVPLLGITLGLICLAAAAFARWRGFSAVLPATGLGMVVAMTFVIAAGRVIVSPAFAIGDLFRGGPEMAEVSVTDEHPDIFLLMLDGYPRSDMLAGWGYDNSWFTDALAERGFDVASASHTNYASTALVLPTMFQMRHAAEIEAFRDVPEDVIAQRRAIRASLEQPPALLRLAELGYETISAGRPADYITLNTRVSVDSGWLNEFEHQVLARTALSAATVPMVLDARRGEILDTLSATRAAAEDPSTTFVFAHVMNPHLPLLFDRDGDPPMTSCLACTFATHIDNSGMTADEFHAAYVDQVHHLNGLVLETIDGILADSPDAAMIVFSDHGSRAERHPDEEWFATFFAARTPGHPRLYPDDARPIEIFPRLFGAYFGDDFPIPVDEDYLSPQGVQMPLDVTRRAP
ncbi:MAG: hypothetical protein ACRDGD_02455 [Candidatus Limnocylindria bacterium]